MPHDQNVPTPSSNSKPPHPCSFRGRHSWLRKTSLHGSSPGVYRKTCTRCGEWEEYNSDGVLLLTSRD